jgi:2'-5' RNA ligase
MSFFLGFLPDKESNYKIRRVVGDVGMIFSDLGIPVRWVKPESFHITLYHLGEHLSIFQRLVLKKRISKIKFRPFSVSLGGVKVGISRTYKELIYLDIDKGGEELRELLLQVRSQFGTKDISMFVPHLTIGRVSKDLSKEEYRNIVKDIGNISKNLKIKDIQFNVNELYLFESKEGVYCVKMKFDAN